MIKLPEYQLDYAKIVDFLDNTTIFLGQFQFGSPGLEILEEAGSVTKIDFYIEMN